MHSVRITNYTTAKLNVALKHICALHFDNDIEPGKTVKLKNVGPVWFTLEVLVDDGKNRYSVANSAACIAIVSLAAATTAAAAGAPLIAAAAGTTVGAVASTVGTAIATAATTAGATIGTGFATAGATIGTGFATAVTTSATFLGSNLGIATTVSSALLPKAMDLIEQEVGGFSQVQKEVVAILSSPTVTEDVRKEGLSILQRLGAAFMVDHVVEERAKGLKEKEEKEREEAEKDKLKEKGLGSALKRLKTISRSNTSPTSEVQHRPTVKRAATTASSLRARMSAEGRAAHQAAKKEAKEEKEVASWEVLDLKPADEPALLSSNKLLRLHGLFVGERKHFEVREKNGKLVLVDALTGTTIKE